MAPEELAAWQKRCGLRTDAEAARALGMGVSSYRQKRTGRASIPRQTELLCAYYEVFSAHLLLNLTEALERLAELTAVPIAPIAAAKVAETIIKVLKNGHQEIDLPTANPPSR